MNENKLSIPIPIIVEGKYDKNTLKQIFDCTVLTVDGFAIFNSKERQALLRELCKDGIIILTDSDGGGRVIRSFINGILPKDKIFNAYIPMIKGKEKRKKTPGKAGLLGVEGMGRDVLIHTLEPFYKYETKFCNDEVRRKSDANPITKTDFFCDGLSGVENAKEKRAKLSEYYNLPTDMTANALLEALNILTDYDGYKTALNKISRFNID